MRHALGCGGFVFGWVMKAKTEFWAIVRKVQTLTTDGSINVTLNLPETAIPQMAEMAAYQIHGVVVDVVVTPRERDEPRGNGNGRKQTKAHY